MSTENRTQINDLPVTEKLDPATAAKVMGGLNFTMPTDQRSAVVPTDQFSLNFTKITYNAALGSPGALKIHGSGGGGGAG